MKKLYILPIILLGACSTAKKDIPPPKYNPAYVSKLSGSKWIEFKDVGDVRGILGPKPKIFFSGGKTIVDLLGGEINGEGMKRKSDQQDEDNVGIKNRIPNLVLRNGYIKSLPGGFSTYAENTELYKLIFTVPGEDFCSSANDIAPGFKVRYCDFYNIGKNSDKAVQGNSGADMLVEGCNIFNGITGVRIQKDDSKNRKGTSTVRGNAFTELETAVNVAGENTVTMKDNKFINVDKKFVESGKGKVIEK